MDDRLTIEQLRQLQDHFDLGDVHLADLQPSGFTIAHTDRERAKGDPLEACYLHRLLDALDEPPDLVPGIYVVSRSGPLVEADLGPAPDWQFRRLDTGR